jgi:hypothetical protein
MGKLIYMERTINLILKNSPKSLEGVVIDKEGVLNQEKYFIVK